MKHILKAIHEIESEFGRLVLLAIFEGKPMGEIFQRIQEIEPELTREDFDRRVISCRKELWKKLR